MGGVINYYHGESGLVVHSEYLVSSEHQAHRLQLQGDTHREFAYDYGADIGIDPRLQPGEQAIFLRLDSYTGIWVRDDLCFYPDLQGAIDRAASQQVRIPAPGQVRISVRGVWTEQAIATTQPNSPGQFSDRPATDVSFFLSFASANVLIARQIFEDLKHDARVEVWFDLDQSGESLAHEGHIGRWLRTAIYSRRGFLLLWTGQAAQSEWVRKEILWAREKAEKDSDFRFIVLKLDDTPIPESLVDTEDVIDCSGLWPVHGVVEELFAAVTGRHGRRIWVRGHQQRGIAIKPDEGSSGYDPFQSDSGAAISLRHWDESGRLCWELEYEKNGKSETASGQGPDQAVDFGIRRGDYVGFFVCHRAPLVRFWQGLPSGCALTISS